LNGKDLKALDLIDFGIGDQASRLQNF
jgi:hypothetical protein